MSKLRPAFARVRPHLPALAGYAVPFVLVLYLALESGGYDHIVRDEVGIIAWWAVLLGVAAGLLPVVRITRTGFVMLGILLAFAVLTTLATLFWTQSTERSVIEIGRVLMLLGCFLLLLLLQRKDGLRRTVGAVAAAIALVAAIALIGRYHPGWFSIAELPDGYPKARLSFPLGYWNGVGALMAMGSALLLHQAVMCRQAWSRALAASVLPLLALATYLTASRGGIIAMTAAVVVLILLFPRRVTLIAPGILAAIGSAILVFAVSRYPTIRDNLDSSAGDAWSMTLFTLLVVGGVWLSAYLLDTKVIGKSINLPQVRRSTMTMVGKVLGLVALIAVLIAVVSGTVGSVWDNFTQPANGDETVSRLGDVSSGERYVQWEAAVDAGESKPLTGIGPGSYEYWWARNGEGPGFVRDAHSLYLEGFAELGILGFLLAVALVFVPILFAVSRAWANRSDPRCATFAAAAGSMSAFAIAAGIDWAWEMTVLPVTFLALVAAVTGPDGEIRSGRLYSASLKLRLTVSERALISIGSVVAIVAIAVPMTGMMLVRQSQSSFRDGNTLTAADQAREATKITPWSSAAQLQLALVEAENGNQEEAIDAAGAAADKDPYSWKAWWVLGSVSPADEDEASEKVLELNRNAASGSE